MDGLQRLRAEHAAAVLAFERVNRNYFSAFISDRGGDFFANFARHFDDALAAQADHRSAHYLLIDEAGGVVGRFNLFEIGRGSAHLGYRVAERDSGRGVATAAVHEMCILAGQEFGLSSLRAAVSDANPASRKVLRKNGFVVTDPASPADLGGRTGVWFEKSLESTRSQ